MIKQIKEKNYWKDFPQFDRSQLDPAEFRQGDSEMTDPLSRRRFLSLMAASMAFAGLTSCHKPVETIVPYVNQPEDMVPGVPVFYATSMPWAESAIGLLVRSQEGRPNKIEGNPRHPASLGGTHDFAQAEILNLYDPDRSRQILNGNAMTDWADFVSFCRARRQDWLRDQGGSLAVLLEPFSSPTLSRLVSEILKSFPKAKILAYAPVSDENIDEAISGALGRTADAVMDFSRANVVLALDADPLGSDASQVRHARDFAQGRKVVQDLQKMSRLYVAEPAFTLTGAYADHKMRIASSEIAALTVCLAHTLREMGVTLPAALPEIGEVPYKEQIRLVAADLLRNKGASLILAGRRQPPAVHSLVLMLNQALGNINKTIVFKEQVSRLSSSRSALAQLTEQMNKGQISALFILGGNPVYDAPADLLFDQALKKVQTTVHLSLFEDETSQFCSWRIPQSHFLEYWGDSQAKDGTAAFIQPLIAPLYNGKSPFEMLNLIASGNDKRGYDILRSTWNERLSPMQFNQALQDGIIPVAQGQSQDFSIKAVSLPALPPAGENMADKMEILFQPSMVYDGRYANNAWLLEIPDPITKLTWDNAAWISEKLAHSMDLHNGDVVHLESASHAAIDAPVWIVPGQADNSIVLPLGYGRTHAGKLADNVGFNAYPLRTSQSMHRVLATINKKGIKLDLANAQEHSYMEGRPLVREATLDEYKANPEFAREMVEHPPLKSLWHEPNIETGYQWGMVIDLSACIGCNACSLACQSENNIPIVGKKQIEKGRRMHWIRMDRYFSGNFADAEMVTQPVFCQHCENAPCEPVCPVVATVHDSEGLNVMVYNRCVGTRYCSNNCPYKARRFNFFNYTSKMPETLKMAQNPDVTVRSRGVMEKCSYCVQRIMAAKIHAKQEGREVKDGEIMTACEQACPTRAIVFGNLNDPDSRIVQLKKSGRAYELLAELNTQPRTSFMAKIRNPNPDWKA